MADAILPAARHRHRRPGRTLPRRRDLEAVLAQYRKRRGIAGGVQRCRSRGRRGRRRPAQQSSVRPQGHGAGRAPSCSTPGSSAFRRARRRSSIRSSGSFSNARGRLWSTPATRRAASDKTVGVYAGASMNTYLLPRSCATRRLMEAVGGYQLMLGNDKDFLCTRVSYKLDLHGPEHDRPDRLLDLAGRRCDGLPRAADRRMRHGAGRRRIRELPGSAPAICTRRA